MGEGAKGDRVRDDGEHWRGSGAPDGVSPGEIEGLRPGAGDELRRRVLLGATGIATALSLAFWLIGAGKDIDSIERIVVPVLTGIFGLLTLLSWQGRLRGAEIGLVAVGGGVLLERIHFVLHQPKPGLRPLLDAYELMIWFPCLFLFAFLVFDKKPALLFSSAILGGAMWVTRDWFVPGGPERSHADLSEFFLGQVGCIILVYGFSMLKDRYLSVHKLAIHLRSFAETDFLTGVPNRRVASHALDNEVRRTERGGPPFAVLLIDLDRFKEVNDRFGHDEGDRVLRRVALVMERSRRQTDVLARWGGEEFLLVAPNLDLEGARRAAERLRALVERSGREGRASATASFGVSVYRQGDDVSSLLKRADRALMEAKARGRNQVVVGDE